MKLNDLLESSIEDDIAQAMTAANLQPTKIPKNMDADNLQPYNHSHNTNIKSNPVVDGPTAIRAAQDILKHCQPFIKEWGGIPTPEHAMYRGMDGGWPDNILYHTQALRKPIGMQRDTQKVLDDYFEQEFGHRYRSVNTLFISGDITHVHQFGEAHVVFPVGNFSYLWSNQIDDLNYELMFSNVHEIVSYANFKHNEGLSTIGNHEVMINTKLYYAIPYKIYKRSVYPLLIKG